VAGNLTAGEIRSWEVPLLPVPLAGEVGAPLSAAQGSGWVQIWVFLAFSSADLKKEFLKWFLEMC